MSPGCWCAQTAIKRNNLLALEKELGSEERAGSVECEGRELKEECFTDAWVGFSLLSL